MKTTLISAGVICCLVLTTLCSADVTSTVDVKIYGYTQLDASYDDSRVIDGNFAVFVAPEASNDDDDQFNMTARQTRLGLLFSGPENVGGRLEIDFYGKGAGEEDQAAPRMRRAYMTLDCPESKVSLLLGQEWDVISPGFPCTLNFLVEGHTGNLGFRRPQARITKLVDLTDETQLKLQLAATRTIGDDTEFDPGDTGEDAGFPTMQARAGVTIPIFEAGKTVIGVSGHWGEQEYDTDATGTNVDMETWSINLDFTQPVTDWMYINGEIYEGENLSAYIGGIAQGVNAATLKEIGADGGWISVCMAPNEKLSVNVGASSEDVDDEDLTAASARTKNSSIFGNAIYKLRDNMTVGFEVKSMETDYLGMEDADAMRYQTTFTYRF